MNTIYSISRYNDWNGNPVKKTPDEYKYSYDAYVISKKSNNYKHAIYSDRLLQWDYNKHNTLCKKHFGNHGQCWDNRSYNKIQLFLQDYYSNTELALVGIMKGCNVGNGFPYWIFMVNCDF